MNKGELVKAMSEKANLSKKTTEAILNAFIEVISDELKKGEKIQLIGFGNFEAKKRAERTGRNPQTGNSIKIPARTSPVFKAGKALKETVNK